MKGINYTNIKELYNKMGYPFYEGFYNVNVFGFRNPKLTVDEFNDIIGIAYQDAFGRGVCLIYEGTTKAGLYYLKNKLGNSKGTFILQEGYFKSCWKSGMHSGKYPALVQKGAPFTGYRDDDSDGQLDLDGQIYNDVTGLNFHTTSFINNIDKVGAYSAGCQVIKDDKDFLSCKAVIDRSIDTYGDSISYALFNMKDFF